jgi:hypothetical protein
MHLELKRLPNEKCTSSLMRGKTNFEGFVLQVCKGDKGIARSEIPRNGTIEKGAADIIQNLKKRNNW